MTEADYTYHECCGLEFVIHFCRDRLLFDVDYNEDLLIIDLEDEYEVNL